MEGKQLYIFVANQTSIGLRKLLPKLGLPEYEPYGVVDLRLTTDPQTLYVGEYNNCLIIAHPTLPLQFFGPHPTEIEQRFTACYPDKEIAVILIENLLWGFYKRFGFSMIQNGRKIRMKIGEDNDYFHDQGSPIPEEKESREKLIIDDEEMEYMRQNGQEADIERYVEFQANYQVPNLISKRYLGECLAAIDRKKVKMVRYKMSKEQ
jgi:hypothetical protein